MPRRSPRTRSVLLATGLLVVGLAPFGVAATGDALREGQRNGTANRETQVIANVRSSGSATGGYATRQSNLSSSGGGAIYGCRSTAGTSRTEPPRNPCLRTNNLSSGLAFEFNAQEGAEVGQITVGGENAASKRPFSTNATGVATGLNADRVDGAEAGDLRTRWALVNEAGQIEAQSGGLTILDAYVTNQNVYIDAGETLETKAVTATIALRNVGGSTFGGEISASRCQIPGVVECAPPASKNVNAFVVSPRNSDGSATAAGARKRFYVTITE